MEGTAWTMLQEECSMDIGGMHGHDGGQCGNACSTHQDAARFGRVPGKDRRPDPPVGDDSLGFMLHGFPAVPSRYLPLRRGGGVHVGNNSGHGVEVFLSNAL